MSRVWLYPYKPGSQSAQALCEATDGVLIRHRGSKFKPRRWKKLVNWGATSLPDGYDVCHVLNPPDRVEVAANKLLTLRALDGKASIPRYSTDIEDAKEWIQEGSEVVCRALLRGHSGRGITIATTEQELDSVPLYTEYTKKKSEWRVHIFGWDVAMIQQKVKRADIPPEEMNWKIRNHKNGFIFRQNGINPPLCVKQEACKAMAALSLDFGAVDVIYNEKQDKAYVLEVNTAPGLEGTTLELYAQWLKRCNIPRRI
jgi:glutathione synthase/RimK-type ligase-like ATP-grasp enzyme